MTEGLQQAPTLPEHLVANARVLPDRHAILPLLPKHKTIVEVGVALGGFSDHLIRICDPQHFIAIDMFELHELPTLWGQSTRELFGGRSHGEFYRDRFAHLIERRMMTVLQGDSITMLETLNDRSVDIVYVDADHTFEHVTRELAVIGRKVTDDGAIIMNDYIMSDIVGSDHPYGVVRATNEFMIVNDWEMVYFVLQAYMYCDVVLRKSGRGPWVPDPRTTDLQRRIGYLERALDLMQGSTSWRVTAPMRYLARRIRGT